MGTTPHPCVSTMLHTYIKPLLVWKSPSLSSSLPYSCLISASQSSSLAQFISSSSVSYLPISSGFSLSQLYWLGSVKVAGLQESKASIVFFIPFLSILQRDSKDFRGSNSFQKTDCDRSTSRELFFKNVKF